MPNIIQQLRADYEASTQNQWSVYARQSYMPQEEEDFLGYEIEGAEIPARGQFVRRGDAAFCVSAHNHMPLLLAVAEAAVAEWNTHRIWKEADENLDDTDEAWDEIWQRIDAAHDAFRAAIEPLLEGEE